MNEKMVSNVGKYSSFDEYFETMFPNKAKEKAEELARGQNLLRADFQEKMLAMMRGKMA